MAHRRMPWWLGYLLINPLRRWLGEAPEKLLQPYVHAGMTVLEPGPGMGFFTLPMAAMAGPRGHVVAVDIQPQMLDELRRRARKAGVLERVETRLAAEDSLGLADLEGRVDFVLAFAMVHETASAEKFFAEAAETLKPGGQMLLAEPRGHVTQAEFEAELETARHAGLEVVERPEVSQSRSALLRRAEAA